MKRVSTLVAFSIVAFGGVAVGADDYAGKPSANGPRYTFSWPLDGDALLPRGGTTKGAPITLDLRDADFAGADVFARQGTITLEGPVDKLGLFMPLFKRADEIAEKKSTSSDTENTVIANVLRDTGALE